MGSMGNLLENNGIDMDNPLSNIGIMGTANDLLKAVFGLDTMSLGAGD